MSSATKCLAVDEILQNILCHCRTDELKTRRKTAYNVALTCKMLLDPGLDELWRVLLSLQPLLSLVPNDVVALDTQSRHHHSILSGSSRPKDWETYTKYAPRVQELYVMASIPNQLEADLNILKTLNLLQLKPPLAPNLRVLCWMKSPLSYASLFMGPSLQSVTLSTIGPDPNDSWAISVALVNIIQASPTIESLVVHDFNCEQTTHIRPATVGLTSCFRLRRLHLLRSISPDLVPILGQLPVLEDLQLKFGDNSGHLSLEHSPSEPLFPRLKSFHALGADLASIPVEWILAPGNAPLLTELAFAATDNKLTADFLQSWFTNFCDRMALTALDVFIPAVELPPGSRATLKTIRPLFALEGLVNLSVSFPFALNDDALGVIAKTWPKLQTLNLGGRDRPFHPTDVTLRGVVRLVANSLSLRDLTINFDASDVAAARKSYEGRAYPHLCGLWAGNSHILDEDSVAAFLRKVFPRVRMRWDHLPRNAGLADFHRKWLRVGQIIQDTTTTM